VLPYYSRGPWKKQPFFVGPTMWSGTRRNSRELDTVSGIPYNIYYMTLPTRKNVQEAHLSDVLPVSLSKNPCFR